MEDNRKAKSVIAIIVGIIIGLIIVLLVRLWPGWDELNQMIMGNITV